MEVGQARYACYAIVNLSFQLCFNSLETWTNTASDWKSYLETCHAQGADDSYFNTVSAMYACTT